MSERIENDYKITTGAMATCDEMDAKIRSGVSAEFLAIAETRADQLIKLSDVFACYRRAVEKVFCDTDSLKRKAAILSQCMSVMPIGNIKTHTIENLPDRIVELAIEVSRLDDIESQLATVTKERDEWQRRFEVMDKVSIHRGQEIEQLKQEINSAVDTIEGQGDVIAELKAENASLKQAQRPAWDGLVPLEKCKTRIEGIVSNGEPVAVVDLSKLHRNCKGYLALLENKKDGTIERWFFSESDILLPPPPRTETVNVVIFKCPGSKSFQQSATKSTRDEWQKFNPQHLILGFKAIEIELEEVST
jgi:hypothetical protein